MAKKRLDDDDALELTSVIMARITDGGNGPAELLAAIKRRRARGAQKAPTKRLVSLRLPVAALNTYRSTGRGWQSRLSDDIEKAAKRIEKQKSTER